MPHDTESWNYIAELQDTQCRVTTDTRAGEIRIYPTSESYPCVVVFIDEAAVLFSHEDE